MRATAGTANGTTSRMLLTLRLRKLPNLRSSLVHRNQTVVNTAA